MGGTIDGIYSRECGDVCFAVWTKAATAARMRALSDDLAAVAARHGSIVVCQFIHSSSKPPDAGGRAEGLKLLKLNEPAMRRLITVPMGDAIWVGIVRSIMRGFFVLLRRSDLLVIAHDQGSAIARILEVKSARTPPAAVLAETLAELFAEAGVEPSKVSGMT